MVLDFRQCLLFLLMIRLPPRSTLLPYTTLFRSQIVKMRVPRILSEEEFGHYTGLIQERDRLRASAPPALAKIGKSTRLNSSHANISYAVFFLKKKSKDLTALPRHRQLVHL